MVLRGQVLTTHSVSDETAFKGVVLKFLGWKLLNCRDFDEMRQFPC